MKKVFKIIGFVLLTIILILIIFLQVSFDFASKKCNDKYEYVFKDVITNMDAKIVNIAMLGSHDSFSDGIKYISKPNYNEEGITSNKLVNFFAKGLVKKMSKSQVVGAKEQLYAGVRYFDVRVSKVDDIYYTCHGYLSNKLDGYLLEIVEFLESHPGEFIIFDLQHFYNKDGKVGNFDNEEYDKLIDYIKTIKTSNGNSLIDFISYDSNIDSIDSLTYGKVTDNLNKASVIMLGKIYDNPYFYFRDKEASYKRTYYENIFSLWHETNSLDDLKEEIKEERDYFKVNDYSNVLRVNQAQRTGFIKNIKIIKSILSWNLLNMAKRTNKEFIKDKDEFMDYLKYMPIFMVDYVTTNKGNFNELANSYIIEFNKGL